MQQAIAAAANAALIDTGNELITLYTRTALAINAFDVTARTYEARADNFLLSTTQNIPAHQRLPIEIEVRLNKQELLEQYREVLLQSVCEDFVIRVVSVMDAGLEDIFDSALEALEPKLQENQRFSKIRGAWEADAAGRTKIASYLIDCAGLQSPNAKLSTIDMVFDRYCEIREVRHALVHNGGQLEPKRLARLTELRDRLPEALRYGSLVNANFLNGQRVLLRLPDILELRNWAYSTILGYLRLAFDRSCVNAAEG